MDKREQEETLVLIKPDALKNSLTGYVLSQLSEFHTGLLFAGARIVHVNHMLAQEHYAEHVGKVFFPSLLEYISGALHYPDEPWKQRVIALVYQGPDAVKKIRALAGPTNPHVARDTTPGCIRSMGTIVPIADDSGKVVGDRMDNLIHASANAEDAEREIKLWFAPSDIPPAMRAYETETVQEFYYLKDNKLAFAHEEGSVCFLAPGNTAWKSDLDMLRALRDGRDTQSTLESVVAKYLINNT